MIRFLLPSLRVFGIITVIFAATMLVPLCVAWRTHDAARPVYLPAMAITIAIGVLLWLAGARTHRELERRDGVLLACLTWMALPVFATLPLLLYFSRAGTPMSFTDAYFECMSGLTTTGATILVGLDALPPSINVWRCFLQWIGGMGILVLAVAILPLLGVGGSELFRAESTGPMKDVKLTPRATETAKGLWTVYVLISLACVLAYWIGGMTALDAWMHMFTTMSLGGLSSHDASFGHFQSPRLEWIGIAFMLVASCNFALYFIALHKRSAARIWQDLEYRWTMAIMVGSSGLVAALLYARGVYSDPMEALRTASFNVVSIASTTGFASTDYNLWPRFAPVFMLLLSGVATSAGSTGAGLKMIRVIIVFKQAMRELARVAHPRAVSPVMIGGERVAPETVSACIAFMMVYGVVIIALTSLLLLSDLNFDAAFSAVVASVNNTGPGLNEVGPASNYKGLSDYQKWVCSFAMMLGRLEILTFLVMLSPSFWRR